MNVFAGSILGIFLLICVTCVLPVWFFMGIKHRNRLAELKVMNSNNELSDEVATLRAQVLSLSQRINVLEAIVTDKGYDLQEKFRQM